MSISEQLEVDEYLATIKVVGIGTGGVNVVNRMVDEGIEGIDLISLTTDTKQLFSLEADVKMDIGRDLTQGRGAGGNPEIGRKAAEESEDEIRELLEGTQMVIITTGEGGGTGTGAAPVVARIAKELGCLTLAVVTKPFHHEGKLKMRRALEGIEELKKFVDSIIIIPNEKLLEFAGPKLTVAKSLHLVDETLMRVVRSITEVIVKNGEIGADFNDIKEVLKDSGTSIIGIGEADGEGRIREATLRAITSPLLDTKMTGAKGIIFMVSGSEESLTIQEYADAAKMIAEESDPDAWIKDAICYDETLGDKVHVVVIATGFDSGIDPDTKIDNAVQTGAYVQPEKSINQSGQQTNSVNIADYTNSTASTNNVYVNNSVSSAVNDANNTSHFPASSQTNFIAANLSTDSSTDFSVDLPRSEQNPIPDFMQNHSQIPQSESVFSSDANKTVSPFSVSSEISQNNSGSIAALKSSQSMQNIPLPNSANILYQNDLQNGLKVETSSNENQAQEDSLELPPFME